jgi:hypothetical protein
MLTSNASPTPAAAASAATPSSAASAASSAAGPNLAGNFNEFLQLLTTQLQHQDPTAPLDPNQFTQELVQFSSVEQQINTNTSLTTMIALQQPQQAASALQFIGDQRDRHQRPNRSGDHADSGRGDRRRCQQDPAQSHDRGPELSAQPDYPGSQRRHSGEVSRAGERRWSARRSMRPAPVMTTVARAPARMAVHCILR